MFSRDYFMFRLQDDWSKNDRNLGFTRWKKNALHANQDRPKKKCIPNTLVQPPNPLVQPHLLIFYRTEREIHVHSTTLEIMRPNKYRSGESIRGFTYNVMSAPFSVNKFIFLLLFGSVNAYVIIIISFGSCHIVISVLLFVVFRMTPALLRLLMSGPFRIEGMCSVYITDLYAILSLYLFIFTLEEG